MIAAFLIAAALAADMPPQMPAPIDAVASSKSMINIDSKARSADYVQAFELLRKDKPTLKIQLRTTGATILNITDVTSASGGTLLLVKSLSNQGTKLQIVSVEELMEISYSP